MDTRDIVLTFLTTERITTSARVAKAFEMTTAQARAELNGLVQSGFATKEGKTRGTKYSIREATPDRISPDSPLVA